MAAKQIAGSWTLRYFAQKLQLGVQETLSQLPNATSATAAVAAGMAVFKAPVSTVFHMTGSAMAPTLNPATLHDKSVSSTHVAETVDKLLLRLIRRPTQESIFVGDIIAFSSPFSQRQEQKSVLIRRVAAGAGEEMISEDPEVEPFTIPEGHCWVLADNEALSPPDVVDSRSFGPLPVENILGRIMYYWRSSSDAGVIENSEEAVDMDAPVLRAELDVDQLAGNK